MSSLFHCLYAVMQELTFVRCRVAVFTWGAEMEAKRALTSHLTLGVRTSPRVGKQKRHRARQYHSY
jgi:hypothetical protein